MEVVQMRLLIVAPSIGAGGGVLMQLGRQSCSLVSAKPSRPKFLDLAYSLACHPMRSSSYVLGLEGLCQLAIRCCN